jgi:hypothetical protein
MSYTKEDKQEALDMLNKAIGESDIDVVDNNRRSVPLYVYLIAIGLLITGVCVLVHGV